MNVDLQIAIANYYADKEIDPVVTLRPSVDVLPNSGNEGDVRQQTSDGSYYIFDGGKWNLLLENTEIGQVVLASSDDVKSAIQAGKDRANG